MCRNGLIWDDVGDLRVWMSYLHIHPHLAGSYSRMAWTGESASRRCLGWLQFSTYFEVLELLPVFATQDWSAGPVWPWKHNLPWKRNLWFWAVCSLTSNHFDCQQHFQIVLRLPGLFSLWTTAIQALILLRPDATAGSSPSKGVWNELSQLDLQGLTITHDTVGEGFSVWI